MTLRILALCSAVILLAASSNATVLRTGTYTTDMQPPTPVHTQQYGLRFLVHFTARYVNTKGTGGRAELLLLCSVDDGCAVSCAPIAYSVFKHLSYYIAATKEM